MPKYRNDETVEAYAATNIMMGSSLATEKSDGLEPKQLFNSKKFELDSVSALVDAVGRFRHVLVLLHLKYHIKHLDNCLII